MEHPMEKGVGGRIHPHGHNHGQNIRSSLHPETADKQKTVQNPAHEMPYKKPRCASGKEIKAKIEDRAWWRERGGKLKLTKPHNPQPEHYIAAVTREIEHLPRISETTPQPNTKMKQSKGKTWNELVLMISLQTFVSRKFAEIDEVHKVCTPKMKWGGDITLGREKSSCVNNLYNLTEEMMKQSSQLLRENIEQLEDKIEWMMLDILNKRLRNGELKEQ
jgi:hypothetical protein